MKNKKIATMVASLALVGVVGLASTLAYLKSESNTVRNTFTVGEGYIDDDKTGLAVWVDEAVVGELKEGEKTYLVGADVRTLDGNDYDGVLPGSKLTKDPTVRIARDSIKSHICVSVTGLDELAEAGLTIDGIDKEWKKISTEEGLDGIYKFSTAIDTKENPYGELTATTPLFRYLTAGENLTEGATLDDVIIKACALQAVTFTDKAEDFLDFNAKELPGEFTDGFTIDPSYIKE